jgi:heme/copper-type cytochrome/quinol oxidase subunit 3
MIAQPQLTTPPARLGLWLFLAADSMFFLGLIGAILVLRSGQPEVFSAGAAALSKPAMALSAILLLAGSAAMRLRNARFSLTLTFLTAAGFLIVTIHNLPTKPMDAFHACYFTLTIVHALHILAAMIAILLLLPGSLPAHTQSIGIYWHFLVLLWILLFPILFFIAGT